jgi:hypothetical protein
MNTEVKLYETDYVLFKDNKPVESLDIIYASESVIDLFNDGFKLEQGEGFIKTTDLPIEWQEKYIAELDLATDEGQLDGLNRDL